METERLVIESGRKAVLLPGDIGKHAESKAVAQKAIDALPPFSGPTKISKISPKTSLKKHIA
jgi:hypothetical protein